MNKGVTLKLSNQNNKIDIDICEEPMTLPSILNEINNSKQGFTSRDKLDLFLNSRNQIKKFVNLNGGNITDETPFSQYADIILFLIEELKEGMLMINAEEPNIKFEHNTITKYTPNADDVITFDISELDVEKCSTMELWLTMPESVVSFSIPDITWVEEPSFDKENTLYAIVVRWDGEKLIANVSYSIEVNK